MKKFKIINKYRFLTTVSILLILMLVSTFVIVVNAKSTSNEILVPVYVAQGDNLWKLSAQYSDDMDIRVYIDRVMTINHLKDANIMPGDLLMFPQNAE